MHLHAYLMRFVAAVACAIAALAFLAGCESAGCKPLLPDVKPARFFENEQVIQAPWKVSPQGWVRVVPIDPRRVALGNQMLSLWGEKNLTLVAVWKRLDALPKIEYFVFSRLEAFDFMAVVFAYDTETGEIVKEFRLPRPGR